MANRFIQFPTSFARMAGIVVVAAVGIAILSGTGVLSPVTRVIGRTTGAVTGFVRSTLGLNRRG